MRCRFESPALRCDNHPEREATNCSLWALRRYLCDECIATARAATSSSPRAAARSGEPIWEMFGGRSGITESAYHNPNAVYERAQSQHTIDRSKE